MKSRIFAVVTAILLVFTLTAPAASMAGRARALTASEWIVPEGYNEHDYNAVASFLEQTDAEGVKNGFKLNPNYDPNDPETWKGNDAAVEWKECDGSQMLYVVFIEELGICGSIDLSECQELELIGLGCNDLSSADFSVCPRLWYVNVSENYGLYNLDLTDCPAMVRIFCHNTAVSEIDVTNKPVLENITCHESQVTELDLTGCTQLRIVSCTYCSLGSLDLSNCSRLASVVADACDLDEFILPTNPDTTVSLVVHCALNNLTSLDLSQSTNLTHLYCYDNRLTELNLSACSELERLDCSVNELTEIDVSHCPKLIQLYCTQNRISQFNLFNNPELALDFVMVEEMGTGYVHYGYHNINDTVVARVFATPNEGYEFVGWINIAGQIVSTDWDFDFSSLIGSEPGLIARFAEKTVVPGDANGDGAVDTEDALLVLRAALGIGGDPEALLEGCDMDENGVIDTTDALLILRLALGIS